MKGKGKGERNTKEETSLKDCPLQFPDFTPVDHAKLCPRYTSILGRDESDVVGIEEIDSLQTEQETLLAAAAKRMRILEKEIQILNSWQDGKLVYPSTPKSKSSQGSESTKRSATGGKDERTSKKLKESSSTSSNSATSSAVKVKGKTQKERSTPEARCSTPKSGRIKQEQTDIDAVDSPSAAAPASSEAPRLNIDIPNRFWALVEPYCSDITTADLKVLEDLIRSHEEDGEYYKIPPLGKHYAEKWSQQDILEEQQDGAKLNSDKITAAQQIPHILKDEDSSPFGPLTQRLVQALIEENIMTPAMDENDATEAASISPRSLARQLNIGNTATLERRIKRELEENGILSSDDDLPLEDIPDITSDDEVVRELKSKQQELRALTEHNLTVLKRLYRHAKEEMNRQELRRKVTAADNEVMEAYRRIQATRAKKKSPSKKELDGARKALRDRETLVRQLDSFTAMD